MANEDTIMVQYYNKYMGEWLDFTHINSEDKRPFVEILEEASRFMDNSQTRVIQRIVVDKVILNG